jgi:4-hydroxyphenylacetate 3-hydroxylase N terminal
MAPKVALREARTTAAEMISMPQATTEASARPMTGWEYMQSIRDGREIYLYGDRVKDVTTHPAFRNNARTIILLRTRHSRPALGTRESAMTSIRGGHFERSRRPGELGVHSTDHFGLIVPDLKVAQNSYGSFGLDVREDLGLYIYGSNHRCALISEGQSKRLNHLSFGVFEDDLERFKQHVEKLGQKLVDPPPEFLMDSGFMTTTDSCFIETPRPIYSARRG